MKSLIIAGACLLLGVAAAFSSSYGDFNTGVAARNRGDEPEAIKALTTAISAPNLPGHLLAIAHVVRGRAYNSQKNYDAAIADYTAAIALKKDYTDAYLERCGTYALKRQYVPAIADCTAAIHIQPNDWRLYDVRMGLYVHEKRYDDAFADYNAFLVKRPNSIDLRLAKAEIQRLAGRTDEALTTASAARDLVPQWAGPYFELGLIQFTRNDLQSALASYDTATRNAPKDAVGYLLKGQMEWALGRFDDAVDSFDDALDQDAMQRYAFMWRAIARSRKGSRPDTRLADRFGRMDLSPWPGPLVSLYVGRATPEDTLKAVAVGDENGDPHQCLAEFYVGEWYAIQGNNADARKLLGETQTSCMAGSNTRQLAAIDLARLP